MQNNPSNAKTGIVPQQHIKTLCTKLQAVILKVAEPSIKEFKKLEEK